MAKTLREALGLPPLTAPPAPTPPLPTGNPRPLSADRIEVEHRGQIVGLTELRQHETDLMVMRNEALAARGLPFGLAPRLRGKTRDDIEASAERLAREFDAGP